MHQAKFLVKTPGNSNGVNFMVELQLITVSVGSPQVSFLMCTLEIPQKIAVQVLLLLTLFTFTFEPFLKL